MMTKPTIYCVPTMYLVCQGHYVWFTCTHSLIHTTALGVCIVICILTEDIFPLSTFPEALSRDLLWAHLPLDIP